MKKYDITALGELLVDMAGLGMSENDNMLFEACPGGAPCNVLAFLANQDEKTAFIGKVGNDFFGKMLKETIDSIGIDTRGLVFDNEVNTTLAFVQKKADGDRDFSFYRNPGADMMLTEAEVDEELIAQSKIFHFGTLSMTSEAVCKATKKAIAVAKKEGCIISFDPNLREPLWGDLEAAREAILYGMQQCDILKISDNEVEFITGKIDYKEGLEEIKKLTTAKVIFMTLGPNGSVGYSASSGQVYAEGVKMESIVDTTGAGDTFFGAALYMLLQRDLDFNLTDDAMKELLQYANGKAAKITQVKGALKAMQGI